MVSYVIRIDRGRGDVAWHTGHAETKNESEAEAFETREQAEAHRSMCGLYRAMGWSTEVVRSKVPVRRE